jgi:hypothetical protein
LTKDWFQRNYPEFPSPPLSIRLGDQTETPETRSESSFSDSMSPLLEREFAEFQRLSQMLNEVTIRDIKKTHERIMSGLKQDIQEDPSRVRDPQRKSSHYLTKKGLTLSDDYFSEVARRFEKRRLF